MLNDHQYKSQSLKPSTESQHFQVSVKDTPILAKY